MQHLPAFIAAILKPDSSLDRTCRERLHCVVLCVAWPGRVRFGPRHGVFAYIGLAASPGNEEIGRMKVPFIDLSQQHAPLKERIMSAIEQVLGDESKSG